jgi:hypothetical protein
VHFLVQVESDRPKHEDDDDDDDDDDDPYH